MEFFPESFFFGRFRRNLFAMIKGDTLLEVGVGTGKNLPYYPSHMRVTAVDFSEEMMKKAEERGRKLQTKVDFQIMDIESLGFENDRFDAVAATFVFCSVPDPLKGLADVKRVLKSQGRFYALEHVRPKGKLLGTLFDRIAPAVADRTGVHINRNTVDNIRNAGFTIELEKDLLLDVFKMIVAKPNK
jgi:ubiquinone/menaquinone biosynthesis C-methylase UbiE